MTKLRLGLLCLLIGVGGCGGGGDGASDVPFFGGVYRVALVKIEDTCGANEFPSVFTATQTVNQLDREVVLDSGNGVLTGSVDDDDEGFTVALRSQAAGCEIFQGFSYSVSDDGDSGYTVAFLQNNDCTTFQCSVGYVGTGNLN